MFQPSDEVSLPHFRFQLGGETLTNGSTDQLSNSTCNKKPMKSQDSRNNHPPVFFLGGATLRYQKKQKKRKTVVEKKHHHHNAGKKVHRFPPLHASCPVPRLDGGEYSSLGVAEAGLGAEFFHPFSWRTRWEGGKESQCL